MITSHIVTSRDGVKFNSQFYSRTDAQATVAKGSDLRFASQHSAAELDAHGDYVRLGVPRRTFEPAPRDASIVLAQEFLADQEARAVGRA